MSDAVEFRKVDVRLGQRAILSDVSFAIPRGAFVGVLGPNGAGKTTMLRAILGLVPVRAGGIAVFGKAPRRGNPAVGYMPQFRRGAAQLPLTGHDLVLGAITGARWGWPGSTREERRLAEAALDEVGAADLARRPINELSGGERQRVLFAQALVGDPELLLLDEPLVSLDPGHQRGIVEAVHRSSRRRDSTVLFCAHDLNPLLGVVDLVLYLGNGSAALGPVDEVVTPQVLGRLYKTPIHVAHIEGRIFVMTTEGQLATCAHEPDAHKLEYLSPDT